MCMPGSEELWSQAPYLLDMNWAVAGDAAAFVDKWGYLVENLGIGVQNGEFTAVLLSGCAIPCLATYGFRTAQDHQKTLSISLFRGENRYASKNTYIGDFEMGVIPPAPSRRELVDVAFAINAYKKILLGAQLRSTGRYLSIRKKTTLPIQPQPPRFAGTPGRLDFPIGIELAHNPFIPIIGGGTTLPFLCSEDFITANDYQKSFEVRLFQRKPIGLEIIASVVVHDIPEVPSATLPLTVTLRVTRSKELWVKVTVTAQAFVQEYGPFPVQ